MELATQDKLTLLKDAIASLAQDCPLDAIDEMNNRVAFVKEAIREIAKTWEAWKIARIEVHGDIEIRTVREYLGHPKAYDPKNPAELLDELMQLAGGDFAAVTRDYFASGWFKHGAIRKALEGAGRADRFKELFTVTEKVSLEEGCPKKKLMSSDERFLR